MGPQAPAPTDASCGQWTHARGIQDEDASRWKERIVQESIRKLRSLHMLFPRGRGRSGKSLGYVLLEGALNL
eukprot:1118201-Pelagomonas_calceolata.AAC.2